MEAEISGSQRKVMVSSVRPARTEHGDSGIALSRGRTLPFVVTRAWSAPAGTYREQWFLVAPDSREVLYESVARETLVWGLQALTELSDTVADRIELQPGTYLVVFALGGLMGGELTVEAAELQEAAA